jgi:hypothetical protein
MYASSETSAAAHPPDTSHRNPIIASAHTCSGRETIDRGLSGTVVW